MPNPLQHYHQYVYSPHSSLYIYEGGDKENLLNNEELL